MAPQRVPQVRVTASLEALRTAIRHAQALLEEHAMGVDAHPGYQRRRERGQPSGYASLGATGLVPMAQLATGTPDGTKFLRDDGALAPVTIPNNAVGNAQAADMAEGTVKCRTSSGTGDPEDQGYEVFAAAAGLTRIVGSEVGDPVRTVGASSTTEQTLVSFTIPKNTLSTAGIYRLRLWGDNLQNSGATNNGRLRVKLGATTVYDKNGSYGNDADRRPWHLDLFVMSRGDKSKQRVAGAVAMGQAYTATAGIGDFGTWSGPVHHVYGDAAEDSASDLTLQVTNQWDAAHASSYFRVYRTLLERVA